MPWPTSMVATGDLITAAQLNQLPIGLYKFQSTGAAIDFINIPAYWTHLLCVMSVQGNSGAQTDSLGMRFNNDTGANYQYERARSTGTGQSSDGYIGQTYIGVGEVPGKSTGGFSTHFVMIANYALVGRHTVAAYGYTSWDTSIVNGQNVWLFGGTWLPPTAQAINRVTIFPGTGSFVTGSVVMLYGMGTF